MTLSERFARVESGVITQGPGPLPYYWQLGDTVHEMHGLTVAEREALGWYPVTANGYDENADPEILGMATPVARVEAGLPVEDYTYDFVPGARAAMAARINAVAEARRAQFVTAGSGQTLEYMQAEREALTVQAMDATAKAAIVEGDFSFLDASIGIDVHPGLGRAVQTVAEAADIVLLALAAGRQSFGIIRKWRKTALNAIETASDDATAYAAYKTALTS